jgi:hypothetical protein
MDVVHAASTDGEHLEPHEAAAEPTASLPQKSAREDAAVEPSLTDVRAAAPDNFASADAQADADRAETGSDRPKPRNERHTTPRGASPISRTEAGPLNESADEHWNQTTRSAEGGASMERRRPVGTTDRSRAPAGSRPAGAPNQRGQTGQPQNPVEDDSHNEIIPAVEQIDRAESNGQPSGVSRRPSDGELPSAAPQIVAERTLATTTVEEGTANGAAGGPSFRGESRPKTARNTGREAGRFAPSLREPGSTAGGTTGPAESTTFLDALAVAAVEPTVTQADGEAEALETTSTTESSARQAAEQAPPSTAVRAGVENTRAPVAEATSGPGRSPLESARFVQRVARAIQVGGSREGTVQLRLNPPELGRLNLEVRIEDGVVTARIEAETEVARILLLDHLPALRERLAEQDYRIGRFQVELSSTNPDGSQHGTRPDDRPVGRSRAGQGERRGGADRSDSVEAGRSPSAEIHNDRRLDVRI